MISGRSANNLKAPVCASLALAFVSFGDAFLYPYLPVNGIQVGVPVVWVGLLLSINRFVRIIANSIMTRVFARYGLRMVTIAAAILAIFSTAGYAFSVGLLAWVTCRILWGLSYSALRISTLGYALEQPKPGVALGVSRSLQELGPLSVLFLAPLIIQHVNPKLIFVLLAIASLPALYFAFKLPATADKPVLPKVTTKVRFPSVFNTITLITALLIDGVLIVSLGILFLQEGENISYLKAISLAAGYLAYRRICLVALSILGGWTADKVGFEKVFLASLFFIVSGLFIIASGWIAAGTIIVFSFYSVFSAIAPGAISENQNPLHAAAENATWRDIGAATGTLLGGFLLTSNHFITILSIATVGLLILFFVQINVAYKGSVLFSWKQ
jgi:MFS transporter, DHA1 family, multidrug resistance protein